MINRNGSLILLLTAKDMFLSGLELALGELHSSSLVTKLSLRFLYRNYSIYYI